MRTETEGSPEEVLLMSGPLLPALSGYDDPQLIAHGTTALVFRAIQTRLNRPVAIKVITADTGSVTVNAAREFATTVALSSQPHIVSIIDTGVTDDDRPYIVMEYCEDGSYAQILRHTGPLSVTDAVEVGIKIGDALHAAHQAGIVHRDVKPSNILRSRFGPALTDFGIARAPDELSSTLTREMMTPHHASPEALLHQAQSGSSDVYSLASTLWTLLVGHPPFVDPTTPAEDMYAFRDRVLHDALPPMPREDVPAWLAVELGRAMSKLPAQRHGSANEFVEALRRGALGLAAAAPSKGHAATPPPAEVHAPGVPAEAWPGQWPADARPAIPSPGGPPAGVMAAPAADSVAPPGPPGPPGPLLVPAAVGVGSITESAITESAITESAITKGAIAVGLGAVGLGAVGLGAVGLGAVGLGAVGDGASAEDGGADGAIAVGAVREGVLAVGAVQDGAVQGRAIDDGGVEDVTVGEGTVAPGPAVPPLPGSPVVDDGGWLGPAPDPWVTGGPDACVTRGVDACVTGGPDASVTGGPELTPNPDHHGASAQGPRPTRFSPTRSLPTGSLPNRSYRTRNVDGEDLAPLRPGRRGALLAAVVALATVAVASVASLLVAAPGSRTTPPSTAVGGAASGSPAGRQRSAAPAQAEPAGTRFLTADSASAPRDVRLDDRGTSVTVRWIDPTSGSVPFVVTGRSAADEPIGLREVRPSITRVTYGGLDPRVNYCFLVTAVYSSTHVAPSGWTCTTR